MNIAFYNGVSGMVAYQQNMDLIAHNMANVNTTGYKASRASFQDLLYNKMYVNTEITAGEDTENTDQAEQTGEPESAQEPQEPEKILDSDGIHLNGHGVRMIGTDVVYIQGSMENTGDSLDVAINGEGFFAVQRRDGSIEYTRNGSFDIGMEGDTGYLVTADGSYVLAADGTHIQFNRVENDQGEERGFDLDEAKERIGIYLFPNPFGLEPVGASSFRVTAKSGPASVVAEGEEQPYQLISGALERSTVDVAQEMVNVIVNQKAFQFNAKMVQTADQVEEIINNLR